MLACIAAVSGSFAQTTLSAAQVGALAAEIEPLVNNDSHALASLSVLAVRQGKVVYQQQWGHQWIDNGDPRKNVAANAQTLYRIASLSKLVTTLGVMKLVEQGQLDLDRDVSDYLGFVLRNPHFPQYPITLRMLLSHTSSLRDDAGYYWDAAQNVHLRDVLQPQGRHHGNGAMWAKNAAPGSYFAYANLPWGVVASVMESVTGERFDRLMRRLILDPMGLPGGFHPADFSAAELGKLATLYRKRHDSQGHEQWQPNGPWVAQVDDYRSAAPAARAPPNYVLGSNGTLFGPQGNCRLSIQSLGHILLMLLNQGQHQGRAILQPHSVQTMMHPQWQYNHQAGSDSNGNSPHAMMQAWGLGLQQYHDRGQGVQGDRLVAGGGFSGYGHFGDAWGLRALLVFNPNTRDGMIFLSSGMGFDPEGTPGVYSSLYRFEEKVLTALYTHALAAPPQ